MRRARSHGPVDQFGFGPLTAGPLAAGSAFGPGSTLLGVSIDRHNAQGLLNAGAIQVANAR